MLLNGSHICMMVPGDNPKMTAAANEEWLVELIRSEHVNKVIKVACLTLHIEQQVAGFNLPASLFDCLELYFTICILLDCHKCYIISA